MLLFRHHNATMPNHAGFSLTDLLATLAVLFVLLCLLIPIISKIKSKSHLAQCLANVDQVNRAVLQYANEHKKTLPVMENSPAPGGWWYYKENVKSYLGLKGPSSASDTVFACPDDRGYDEGLEKPLPFHLSKKHNFTSYVFNGVNLPGLPNIAGRTLSSIKKPDKTLMVMEWTAHGPLSWHKNRTGKKNTSFYNNAESVVGFVDGHVALTPIYYDGLNAAYTRDPLPNYSYKYSGD